MAATRVSLIALVTPITALLLGSWLNNEPIVGKVWLGTLLISGGLVCFEKKMNKIWKAFKN
jgi:drug/metabolite transporter (DMT)-like permease